MLPTVFQQALRAPFFNLPDSLRALHSLRGHARYRGRASVERGHNLLSRMCAAVVKLPPEMHDAVLVVNFQADEHTEVWQREFNGHCMNSRLRCRGRMLCERIGPLAFRFELHAADGVLYWNVASVRILGILPLPTRLFSGLRCREYEYEGRYCFEVRVSLPLVGLLIHYRGWLEFDDVAQNQQ